MEKRKKRKRDRGEKDYAYKFTTERVASELFDFENTRSLYKILNKLLYLKHSNKFLFS